MKPVRLIRAGLGFSGLIIGAIFVLFPFFWMLSTSFKFEGTGRSFEFWPKRESVVGPFDMAKDGSVTGPSREDKSKFTADSMVQIAFNGREALSVSITLEDEQGQTMTSSLSKSEGALWKLDKTIAPGHYTFSYHVSRSFMGAVRYLYTFENYESIAGNASYPFFRYLFNSFLVAFSAALLTVIICALAAYVFAKKNFAGKTFLFWTFMAAMMIPGMMYMVPQFAIVTSLGWSNSLQGLVIPHLANIFGLFMLKQFMEAIPDSLFEAARIDGAGEWTIFRRIVFPLALPSMSILFLLTFVGQWNNFLWQLLINTPDSPLITLPVGLALFKGQYQTRYELMMAASSFSIIPIVALFLFTQRFLIEGLTAGGVKE